MLWTLGAPSCILGNARFHVERAAEIPPASTLSVMGAYRDGRMSVDEWERIGAAVSRALGQKDCEVAWGDRLADKEPALYAAIDADSREEGLSTEVVQRLGPKAAGDLILGISVFGRPPPARPRRNGLQNQQGAAAVPGSRRGGMGSRSGYAGRNARTSQDDEPAFEMKATLVAAKSGALAATLAMRYTGSDRDEAIQRFTDELLKLVPGATCAPWQFGPAPPEAPAVPTVSATNNPPAGTNPSPAPLAAPQTNAAPLSATITANQGEPCPAGTRCADGLECVSFYGMAGPRGPKFTSCEHPCPNGKCPGGQRCTTISDGPGRVCRPN